MELADAFAETQLIRPPVLSPVEAQARCTTRHNQELRANKDVIPLADLQPGRTHPVQQLCGALGRLITLHAATDEASADGSQAQMHTARR